ncbi:3-isopropylmalate dehydratase small subunit [Candidatus Dojkabacteria bacterium]|nr:3-isopropylmalate dehydratase small subunit [Candidatus Dojkabacteria bacterium]
MEKLVKLISKCIPVRQKNVDTDQIMPARFLISVSKTGYGENLFRDWRYDESGNENPDSLFNKEEYKNREIIVAGDNFGCGSSREHAVWGLVQYGIRVVISSMFADIFKKNSLKNGLLLVQVTPDELQRIFSIIEADPDAEITVDLANQNVVMPDGSEIEFEIDPFRKQTIMEGQDDTAFIMANEDKIVEYESRFNK